MGPTGNNGETGPTGPTGPIGPTGAGVGAPTIGNLIFSGGAAGYQTITGLNKTSDEEPVDMFTSGNLAGLSFSVPKANNLANGNTITIAKINVPTQAAPAPLPADIMATITVSGIAGGSVSGPLSANILPGEIRILNIGSPPTNVTFTWVTGLAGNSFVRDEYITFFTNYGANNSSFFLNFQ